MKQPCYEVRRRKLLLIYVWKIENQVKKAKALESLDSVTILFFGSSVPGQIRKEGKNPDMTTSQHVSYRGGGSYLTRLRAIKSLLVYFLKCRDWRSYISRPLGTASSGQGSTKGSLWATRLILLLNAFEWIYCSHSLRKEVIKRPSVIANNISCRAMGGQAVISPLGS